MPLDTRFAHWLQAADDELLYQAGELRVDAGDVSCSDAVAWATPGEVGEARARVVAREHAALREDEAWEDEAS